MLVTCTPKLTDENIATEFQITYNHISRVGKPTIRFYEPKTGVPRDTISPKEYLFFELEGNTLTVFFKNNNVWVYSLGSYAAISFEFEKEDQSNA